MTNEPTVETIADASIWETITEGVDAVSPDLEAVFEFEPDRLRVRKKDAANVALSRQAVDATDFEHYEVEDAFAIGVDTGKLDELLGIAKDADVVQLDYNWDNYSLDFKADGVEYEMAGVDPDSVKGSPVDVPPVKDEHGYNVFVTIPVERWDRGTDVAELSGAGSGQGIFVASDDEVGTFVLEGKGDNDSARVKLHDDDGFEWLQDPPESFTEARMSNKYMPNIVDAISEDYVRFITGHGNPYHVFTERDDGRVDTKFMQAPLLDTNT